jgi:hypothetical protein
MLTDNKFISYVLIMTVFEISVLAFIFIFQDPTGLNTFRIKTIGNIELSPNFFLLIALSLYIFLLFTYKQRFWLAAFILKCLVISLEIIRINLLSENVILLNIKAAHISKSISFIEIILILIAYILINKFKKSEKYPKFSFFRK